MSFRLAELLNISVVEKLLNSFFEVTGIPSAVADVDGEFLIKSGWQEICTDFHRLSPCSQQRCQQSDYFIKERFKNNLLDKPYIAYRCLNGLMDYAAPIIIEGQFMGAIFTGQLLNEPPDEEFFRRQAQECGFEEEAYLQALKKVVIVSAEQMKRIMNYFTNITQIISDLGLERLHERKVLMALQDREERLELVLNGSNDGFFDWDIKTGEIYFSPRYFEMLGYLPRKPKEHIEAWNGLLHPDDRDRVFREIDEHFSGKVPLYKSEYRLLSKSGDWKWISARGKVVHRDEQGNPLRLAGIHTDITDRRQAEQALQASEDRYRTLVESINDVIFTINTEGHFTYMSPVIEQVSGNKLNSILCQPFSKFVHPDDLPEVLLQWQATLKGERKPYEFRAFDNEQKTHYIRTSSRPLLENGQCIGIIGIMSEITAQKQAEEALRKSEQRYRQLIANAPLGIIIIDLNGQIIDANSKILEIMDSPSLEATCAINVLSFPPLIQSGIAGDFAKCIEQKTSMVEENYYLSKWGKKIYLRYHLVPLYDDSGNVSGVQGIMEDFSQRKEDEDRIRYLNIHDSLTGLFNRSYFEEVIRDLSRGSNSMGMVVCDVDGLKMINNSLGHAAGDQILLATARIIRSCFSKDDIIARIGGDEFVIIIPDCNSTELKKRVQGIRNSVVAYNTRNEELHLSISIGFAVEEPPYLQLDELFKKADNYMRRDKLMSSQSARNGIVQTLIKALEARDFITEGHARRLQDLVLCLAQNIGLPEHKTNELLLFANFHDIGKVGIPDRVLFKAGPLSPVERKEMQRHSEIGHGIALAAPDLVPVADFILKHHEWWNGEGYPFGLKGEEIPLKCRILAIADAYDAMTNDRPYRRAMSREEGFAELRKGAGTQFDPELVTRFIKMIEGDE